MQCLFHDEQRSKSDRTMYLSLFYILKIAHHGSKTSSSCVFLEAVAPKIAILLVGKDNRYGHPSDEILVNLLEYGI
jgi:beta-lactamase superfamily II metal-dependent hydrolase